MWIRLTKRGYSAALAAVSHDEAMVTALSEEVEQTRSQVDVHAPYAAWHYTSRQLHRIVFGPRGGIRTPANKHFTALQRITRAMNTIDSHPALMGLGMMGWQTDVIPAWKIGKTHLGRKYSPYPQPGLPFIVLTPQWERLNGLEMTVWESRWSGEGRLAQENLHLTLWRGPST
jgi:hypothetical protein